MPGRRVTPQILEEEYALFKIMMPDSPDLPERWEEWRITSTMDNAQLETMGYEIAPIVVEYAKFVRYCVDSAIHPSYEFLRAYAMIVDSWLT